MFNAMKEATARQSSNAIRRVTLVSDSSGHRALAAILAQVSCVRWRTHRYRLPSTDENRYSMNVKLDARGRELSQSSRHLGVTKREISFSGSN
jgi:hypothetical protein